MDERRTDSQLVQSCQEGNTDAYRTLMDRHRDRAMALAMNILANHQDAEDATQEAFLRAFRGLGTFNRQKSFKNWFLAILAHYCLDLIRKRQRHHRYLDRVRREGKESLAAPALNQHAGRPLYFSLLSRLRPKERTALYLWSQEGYSGAEIAAVLDCSQKTAHVHLFRARTRLKAILKEERNAPSP